MLVLSLGLAACGRAVVTSAPLPQVEVTDQRYKGLVFLVATVHKAGQDFLVTNGSTQPWFDITLVLVADGASEYTLHLDEIDAGQSVTAQATKFVTLGGLPLNSKRVAPRTLIVSAEIGEGGPTGVYAVRL